MSSRGIYATHRLYEESQLVSKNMVVECCNGEVDSVYPFECEKHSMLWFDAIVLSKADCSSGIFKSRNEFLDIAASAVPSDRQYAYGINDDRDVCVVSRLS